MFITGVITLESFLRPDTGEAGRCSGDQCFARNAYIGLEGGFGKVYLGRNTTPYFISDILSNPFSGSFGFGPSTKAHMDITSSTDSARKTYALGYDYTD